jgi:phosphopantetheine adenylyltransferase/dephospho-CoA kinase
MFVIGLTGGIGSGKTTVAKLLEEQGAVVLNADLVGHEVYQPGMPAWGDLVDAFGEEIVAEDGTIDRKKLGAIVFAAPENLKRLNAIVHPRMKDLMLEKLAKLGAAGTEVVVLEAAILFEAGWQDLTDEVWALVLPAELAAQRTAERSGIPMEQVLERIKAQMSSEERAARADVTIDTGGTMAETEERTLAAWARLRERLAQSR